MDDGRGVAGASARREHEWRRARDEQKIRDAWGVFGGIAVVLSGERQSTSAWDRGAVGEERVGAMLDRVSGSVRVLHDRRIPGSRANIDHLVVTEGGVRVVDAKRYTGRPTLRVEGGLFRPRTERLLIGGRDQTKLVVGVRRQMDLIAAHLPEVHVRGVLCFVDADWPIFAKDFTVDDVQICWPTCLAETVTRDGSGAVDVEAIADDLARYFHPA